MCSPCGGFGCSFSQSSDISFFTSSCTFLSLQLLFESFTESLTGDFLSVLGACGKLDSVSESDSESDEVTECERGEFFCCASSFRLFFFFFFPA